METFFLDNFFLGDVEAKTLSRYLKSHLIEHLALPYDDVVLAVDAEDRDEALRVFVRFLLELIKRDATSFNTVIVDRGDAPVLWLEPALEVA